MAHSVYCAEVYRFGDIALQFLAKSEDMIGHGTKGGMILLSPHFFQQFIAADQAIRIAQETARS
jgi:hypothetical protein